MLPEKYHEEGQVCAGSWLQKISPSRQKGMVEGPNNGKAWREELFPGWAHVLVARKEESRAHTGQNLKCSPPPKA